MPYGAADAFTLLAIEPGPDVRAFTTSRWLSSTGRTGWLGTTSPGRNSSCSARFPMEATRSNRSDSPNGAIGRDANRGRFAGMGSPATDAARAVGARSAGMAARSQIRWVPHECAAGPAQGAAADRTGIDWTHKHPTLLEALCSPEARQACLDGEFCGVYPDGITSFGMIEAAWTQAMPPGWYFCLRPLASRRRRPCRNAADRPESRVAELLSGAAPPLHYSDYHRGRGCFPSKGLRIVPRGDRLEARRGALCPWGSRSLGLRSNA